MEIRIICRNFASQFAQPTGFCQLSLSVLKRLKHIINWTIWTLVALYVLLLILIHLPGVQRGLGHRVADLLADKLGTEVNIGRIDLGFFNRLILDDVEIRDQADSTMLRASRLSVKLDLLPLMESKVSISSAQIFGARVLLYRTDSVAPLNCQFAVDAFSSADTTSQSALDLSIKSLIVRHSIVSYDRYDRPATPGRLCPDHLRLSNISANVQLKALRPDTLNVYVRRLSFGEQSGLDLRRASLRLEANPSTFRLTDLLVQLPATELSIPSLEAKYRFDEQEAALYAPKSTASLKLSLPAINNLTTFLGNLKISIPAVSFAHFYAFHILFTAQKFNMIVITTR